MITRSVTRVALAGLMMALCIWPCPGPPAQDPLEGTSWVLFAYRRTMPIEGSTFTARFDGGRIRGSAGCNEYSAAYSVRADSISVSELEYTERTCAEPPGLMEQESLLLRFLADARTFRFVDDQLRVVRQDGETLTFVAGRPNPSGA